MIRLLPSLPLLRLVRFLIIFLVPLLLCAQLVSPVGAQSGGLTITITTPYEAETFYAGPSSLLYITRITGWVTTNNPDPSLIHLRLEISHNGEVTTDTATRLRPDGIFVFEVTVNPGAPRGDFTIAEIENGCENCHYATNLSLPSGRIHLRLSATDPSGQEAIAERNIVVDRSTYAVVPVRVLSDGRPVPRVPVIGATRLYLWRSRSSTAMTDSQGETQVHVEALSQALTHYDFDIEPAVIDGVLYKSEKPVKITLVPGMASVPPITLQVRGQTGKLSGNIKGTLATPETIHAIFLPSGKDYSAQTSTTGTFEFSTLPIGSYLVIADERALAEQGYSAKSQTVDLFQSPSTVITIPIVPTHRGPTLQGNIHDAKGNALPFAWIAIEKAGLTQSNVPDSGNYVLGNLENESMAVIASAPGYYHVAQVVDPNARQVDFELTRRPETKSIAWGAGEVVVPPESQAAIDQQQISLEYGWLWGKGGADHPLTIRVAGAEIVLARGKFALEYLLPNHTSWFYVMEGDATVHQNPNVEPITVHAGEMVALTEESRWVAVPLDLVVMTALRANNVSPFAPQWEPTVSAQVRDRFAQMGIGLAQIATLITYVLILPVLFLALFVIIIALKKRRA